MANPSHDEEKKKARREQAAAAAIPETVPAAPAAERMTTTPPGAAAAAIRMNREKPPRAKKEGAAPEVVGCAPEPLPGALPPTAANDGSRDDRRWAVGARYPPHAYDVGGGGADVSPPARAPGGEPSARADDGRRRTGTVATTTTEVLPDGSLLVTERLETRMPDGSLVVDETTTNLGPTSSAGMGTNVENFAQPMNAASPADTVPTGNAARQKSVEEDRRKHRVLLLVISILSLAGIVIAIVVPLVLKKDSSPSEVAAEQGIGGIDIPPVQTSTTARPAPTCPEFHPGVYEAPTCWQSDSGYRQYGVRLEIPEGNDCTSGTQCRFSYPGLECHGYFTYLDSCGRGCLRFEEHYVVETGCITAEDTVFTLQEVASGEYTHSWSTTSTSVVSMCENVRGPALGCEEMAEPTEVECETLPSGVYAATKCRQSTVGYRDYGVRIEIPPRSDCSKADECLFSYPGLSCHGYVLFDGTCGEGCYRFGEHYVVSTGCYTSGSPTFTLRETADGQYKFDWSASGTGISTWCDNVMGPYLVCYEAE